MWWLSTQETGGSAKRPMRLLGLRRYRTGWAWLQLLRRAIVHPGREKFVGMPDFSADSLVTSVEASVELGSRVRLRHTAMIIGKDPPPA